MITIALDESGTFEKYGEEGQSDILLIAGIVYDDKKNENDKKMKTTITKMIVMILLMNKNA